MKNLFLLLFLNVFVSLGWAQNAQLIGQSEAVFRDPESIVFDEKRQCYYISNMDKSTPVEELLTDPISMMSFDGKNIEVNWMTVFSTPTGLLLHGDQLYVVERNGIAIVDIDNKNVIQRIAIPNTGYLNDLTIDQKGRIFVTDSEKGQIFCIENGESSLWYQTSSNGGLNGILSDGKNLIFGDNGDHTLKRIKIKNKKVKNITVLGEGNIDGIQKLKKNTYLVSHFLGNLYHIQKKGRVQEIFNSRDKNLFIADFTYLPRFHMLAIPSLRTHHIFFLRYEP